MSNGHWRKSRHMQLVNRGLETHISMGYLPETDTYRVSQVERMLGGIPSTTYDRILNDDEATDSFRHLCVEAVELDFTMPERTGTRLIDVNAVAQAKIDGAYLEDK